MLRVQACGLLTLLALVWSIAAAAFTAVLVLQATERGEINLDDPLALHFSLPDQSPAGAVTIDQLLWHTSGIKDFGPSPKQGEALRDCLVRTISDEPMDFAPGTRQQYCNVGYTLLGELLEKVTGQSLDALLQQHICGPANLNANS